MTSARPRLRRRPTQAERRSRTRASVLKAAAAVFARRGYHGATLDEIGDRAGVSKGSVYYNFASKQDLFLAVLEERIGERLEEIRSALDRPGPTAAKAEGAAASFLDQVAADPRWGPLFFEFLVHAARDPAARRAFAGWLRDTRSALAELISARYDELGVAPPLPPEELAVVVSALANGMLIERMFDPNDVGSDLFGRALAALAR